MRVKKGQKWKRLTSTRCGTLFEILLVTKEKVTGRDLETGDRRVYHRESFDPPRNYVRVVGGDLNGFKSRRVARDDRKGVE